MVKITFKGSTIHTIGELPAKGMKAPDFRLVNQKLEDKSLVDFGNKKKLLSTVPSLDTGVCAATAKSFNEFAKKHPQFVFLLISADLPFAQKRFCSVEEVNNIITLSTMRGKEFAERYGVLIQDGPLAGICARAVIVLDEHNTVLYNQLVPEITHEPDYEKAFHALQ